jgi:ribosomal protein L11 methyltransferase
MNEAPDQDTLYAISIHTNYAAAGLIEELFPPDDQMLPSSFVNDEEDTGRVDFYFDSCMERDQAVDTLSAWLSAQELPADWQLECHTIKRENWAESWKAYFKPERVSTRLVICPPWEKVEDLGPDDIVLEIDPGMTFGTGQHGTTRACLQFLDQLSASSSNQPFLDIGCGTGILSLAALKLGLGPVKAIDMDEQAVLDCQRHLQMHGLEADVQHCSLEKLDTNRPWPIVAANILASVLIDQSDRLTQLCQAGGYLLLSGILTSQYEQVKTCFESRGFREVDVREIDEWKSGLFRASA